MDVLKTLTADQGDIILLQDYSEVIAIIRQLTSIYGGKLLQLSSLLIGQTDENNILYQATGLVWKAADNIIRIQLKSEIPEEGKEMQKNIWRGVFECLIHYAMQPHPDTRNSAIRTFSMILLNNSQNFSLELWIMAFSEQFLELVDSMHEIYLNFAREEEAPTESGRQKMLPGTKLDIQTKYEDRARKNLYGIALEFPLWMIFWGLRENKMVHHHSRDTLEKQYEETLINLIEHFTKLSKKFFLLLFEKYNALFKPKITLLLQTTRNEMERNQGMLKKVFGNILFMLRIGKFGVYLEILKAYHEIITVSKKSQHLNIQDDIFTIIDETNNMLNRSPKDQKEFKFIVASIIPEILALFADYVSSTLSGLHKDLEGKIECFKKITKIIENVLESYRV